MSKSCGQLFDTWPERYRQWFETPIGQRVKEYETRLVLDLLQPRVGERILDAGCGSGLFTEPVVARGAGAVGLDISLPMLRHAVRMLPGERFFPVAGDMLALPFADEAFDKALSVTALEFIEDARGALEELFRVTRPGGRVVVATLNSLSPWAARREAQAREKCDSVFRKARFRSPEELRALVPVEGEIRTAIHFEKSDSPEEADRLERKGAARSSLRGAFLIACWRKGDRT
ncbi:MAG: class I SAM-dependent methyltransferase [Gammaproteobacteria bacterium]